MPDEMGKAYTEAAAELDKVGIEARSAEGAPPGAQITLTPATTAGTVLAQSPPAGARIDTTTNVVLWIAGPTPR